jgi:N,N'-diacetylbacillosaminyl-diphospho-undecaprenol alpha-1,3-N-acetylgalactosaminyltransferase
VTGLGYLFTDAGWKARLLRVPVRHLARRAFAAARRVSFQNEQDLQELADLVPAQKTVIIRGTGIDTAFFSAEAADPAGMARLREEARIAPGDFVVTFIGRLLAHGIVGWCGPLRRLRQGATCAWWWVGATRGIRRW